MSGFDYAGLRDGTVAPLLQKFGTAVTYRSFTDSFDQATGKNTRTPTDLPTFAVIGSFSARLVDGLSVKVGDKRFLLAGVPEPSPGDQIIVGTDTWTVVALTNTTAPAGVAVAYEVQAR